MSALALDDAIARARAACPGAEPVDEAVWAWVGARVRDCMTDDPFAAQKFHSATERENPEAWTKIVERAVRALLLEPDARYSLIVGVLSLATSTTEHAINEDMPPLFGFACVARSLSGLAPLALDLALENRHLLGPFAFCHLSDLAKHIPTPTAEANVRLMLMLLATPWKGSGREIKREKMRQTFREALEAGHVPDLSIGNADKALAGLREQEPDLAAHVDRALLSGELPVPGKKNPLRRM